MNTRPLSKSLVLTLALTLSACATVNIDQSIEKVNRTTLPMTAGSVVLALNPEQAEALKDKVQTLLSKPVSEQDSVQLMLANSPSFQALLAKGWLGMAESAQTGRIANPVFNFERITVGSDELELGRLFSFGLLDLLTLPWRQQAAQLLIERAELSLISDVVQQVNDARLAWIDAVVANQKQRYAEQVLESAQASAELAKRMESVGNFTPGERIRQQLFLSDAAVGLALAKQSAVAKKENLVRLLGLTTDQAMQLQLPDRLPDLPEEVLQPADIGSKATVRLDVQMAKLDYDAALKANGISQVGSFVDIEAGIRRNTVYDNGTGSKTNPKGYELDIRLPLFDWGGLKRDKLQAKLVVSAQQLEATMRQAESHLRESYHGYRTAYDIAKHYATEVIPMQEVLAEESVYKYNGMLIGTFELLAESRARVKAVQAAMDATAGFMQAQIALESTLMGRPMGAMLNLNNVNSGAPAGAGH